MAVDFINSGKVQTPNVPLSHAARTGNLLFVSGLTPFTREGGIAKGDFEAQMRQVMENLKDVLEEAGSSFDKIVKTNVVLVDIKNFAAMNKIYKSYFAEGKYPARITMGAALANKDFLLEIECVAEN